MNNSQISQGIKRLANMMKLLDENPFKIKAFEKAAGIVENHPEEMGVLIDEDRLKEFARGKMTSTNPSGRVLSAIKALTASGYMVQNEGKIWIAAREGRVV